MFLKRAAWSIASIVLGLTATVAQAQVQGTVAPGQTQTTTVTPPLFQGIVVDAKGKTVGRIYINAWQPEYYGFRHYHMVIRQIDGVWVAIPASDFTSGFSTFDPNNFVSYYQSSDCTGQAYMVVNPSVLSNEPAISYVTTIPPSSEPYIYFAGTPVVSWVTISSQRQGASGCSTVSGAPGWVGPMQSVPVSSLGLTLPF
jgi:hypothetical protein